MDIPGFKLGRQYAEGPYCKGYNALDLSNHKTVNIQVFDASLLASQAFVEQFQEISGRLTGAGFGIMARVLQAEISSLTCYVISEYFPSSTQPTSTPTDLTRDQLLRFALQLAQTLDQLHKAGLVHGGIESSSLYFRSSDSLILRPVILQRVLPVFHSMTFESPQGSPSVYLAPEAAEGLTPATDYYALGVVLYQLFFDPASLGRADYTPPEAWSFNGENRDLEPFFRQLLANDADYRIQSLDRFRTALQQCGVKLPDTATPHADAAPVKRQDDRATASSSIQKWIFAVAGVIAVALAGSYFLLLPREQNQELADTPEVAASDTIKPETAPLEQTPKPAQKQATEAAPDIDNLYRQALVLVTKNPKASLKTIELVLKHKPDHLKALKLKKRIEKELTVRTILDTAERQLEEMKLLQPSDDNAYASYLTLAEMLSADDERVQSGLNRIAAAYHGQAEKLFKQNHLEKAQKAVELGLSVSENYPPLLDLSIRIKDRKNTSDRNAQSALLKQRQLRENKRRRKEQQQKLDEQRQRDEQKRLLAQLQQTEEQQRRQQEQAQIAKLKARQKEAVLIRQVKVDALLKSAHDQLNSGQLSPSNVFSAHQNYEELIRLDDKNSNLRQLQKDLIDAYSILAIRQNSDKLYERALQALEQGRPMEPQDRRTMQIRSQLQR